MSDNVAAIETKQQFKDTPNGKQARWELEIAAAKDSLKKAWSDGDKVIKEYLGERGEDNKRQKRLNLFYADVTTTEASLGGVPQVRCDRRFSDPQDDVARVSSDMLSRLLNTDIEREDDGFRTALEDAKGDWQRPGLGVIRFRYVADFKPTPETPAKMDEQGNELAPAVPAGEEKSHEDVETDYQYWRSFLYSPCRRWSDCRWVAFEWELTRDAAAKRFGKAIARRLPIKSKLATDDTDEKNEIKDAWKRICGWEIWDKESRTVIQFVEGHDRLLEEKPDELGLPNFFPCPRPLFANTTTSKLLPRSNYFLVEDLYAEAHELTTRIRALVRACKAVGAYDKASSELKRLLDDACENELIASENWSLVKERGGIAGAFEMLPIEAYAKTILVLVEQRNAVKADIYEITGQSDIMRGQSAEKATATTDRIKARFGGMRIEERKKQYARFASEAQRIRAFIIAKHFDPETIIQRSNIEQSELMDAPMPPPMPGQPPAPPQKIPNRPLIEQAVQMLKSDIAQYRIEVDVESLSMTDFDAVQQEAISFMTATSEFFQRWAPLIQGGGPVIAKFAVRLYQAFAAQLRGANRFETIIDDMISQLEQMAANPPPPQPDPKVESEKIKAGAVQMKAQADVAKTQMDMQASTLEHAHKIEQTKADIALDREKTRNAVIKSQAAPPGVELKED